MKRGDVVVAALAGDYGKPRPAIVVQNDALEEFGSVLVCPTTSLVGDGHSARMTVAPTVENGLRARSEVMVEKITAIRRDRVAEVIGRFTTEELEILDARLALVLGLG